METIKIEKEKLEKMLALFDDIESLSEKSSNALANAKINQNKNRIKIKRDGKEVFVTEADLWEEIRYLGQNSEAGKILKERYPDVFNFAEEHDKKTIEIREYVLGVLGIDYRTMKLSDYIRLTLSLIDYKLNEKENGL